MALISIGIAQFPAMICSASAEGSLNRVVHPLDLDVYSLTLSESFLFILFAFDTCLPFSSV